MFILSKAKKLFTPYENFFHNLVRRRLSLIYFDVNVGKCRVNRCFDCESEIDDEY